MDHLEDKLNRAVDQWDARGWPRPLITLVSGSGLAVDLDHRTRDVIRLADLFGGELNSIVGHPLEVHLLEPQPNMAVLYYRGRIHGYQGHTAAEVVFPIRLAALLGAKYLLVTNAAGGLRREMSPGDLVCLTDHLNLMGKNPLDGEPPAAWGPRFPDMAEIYDGDFRTRILELASDLGISLKQGVYAGVTGPSYETPAEVKMLGKMGGDVVGMSTVLESIAANHMGLKVAGISLVTNLGSGLAEEVLVHEDVIQASQGAARQLQTLFNALLQIPRSEW